MFICANSPHTSVVHQNKNTASSSPSCIAYHLFDLVRTSFKIRLNRVVFIAIFIRMSGQWCDNPSCNIESVIVILAISKHIIAWPGICNIGFHHFIDVGMCPPSSLFTLLIGGMICPVITRRKTGKQNPVLSIYRYVSIVRRITDFRVYRHGPHLIFLSFFLR